MLKIFLFLILILLIISILLIFFIKNRKQATQIFSIQTFLGNSSNTLDNEPNEQKKSLIDAINDFFKDGNDETIDDDNGDIGGDGDDAGE